MANLLRYGEALIYVLLAFVVRWVVGPYLSVSLPFQLFLVSVAVAAWRCGVGPAVASIALSASLGTYYFLPPAETLQLSAADVVVLGLFLSEATLFTLLIIRLQQAKDALQRHNASLEDQVAERTRGLARAYDRVSSLTRELALTEQRGRRQLALELHDYLAQLLVVSRIKVSKWRRLSLPADMPAEVQSLDDSLDQALTYCRTLVADLHPPGLDAGDLPVALGGLVERFKREGLTVHLEVIGQGLMASTQAVLLYQSVRELLVNVLKHAQVDAAALSVTFVPHGDVRITVEDRGVGFDPHLEETDGARHVGLESVKERLQTLGGQCIVQSRPGHGTRVDLTVPASSCLAP